MQSTQRAYFYRRFPILHLESGDWLPALGLLCAIPRAVYVLHVSVFLSLPHSSSCLAVPVPCAALGSCPLYACHRPPISFTHRENHGKTGFLRAPPRGRLLCAQLCVLHEVQVQCVCAAVCLAEGQLYDLSAVIQRITSHVGQQQDMYRGQSPWGHMPLPL